MPGGSSVMQKWRAKSSRCGALSLDMAAAEEDGNIAVVRQCCCLLEEI